MCQNIETKELCEKMILTLIFSSFPALQFLVLALHKLNVLLFLLFFKLFLLFPAAHLEVNVDVEGKDNFMGHRYIF